MHPFSRQNLLAANCGDRRVTLGIDAPEELRSLSDARALTCPGCGGPVVLHAGAVRAHHFAHLPGAVCSLPQTEQRADVLAVLPGRGRKVRCIALEFQCANLSAREWRRRHRLYREADIPDLWLLGGSRLDWEGGATRSTLTL